MKARNCFSFAAALVLAAAAFAQNPPSATEAEKQRLERRAKLVEGITGDLVQLKLPENQAYVSAKLGSLIWNEDRDRATELFKRSIEMLLFAQATAEASRNSSSPNHDLLWSQSLRPNILRMIGAVDAETALDALYRTRPSAIVKALAGDSQSAKISNLSHNSLSLAQNELGLEHRLVVLAAEQKPATAMARLKESIKKQLTTETLEMLKRCGRKSPPSPTSLRMMSSAGFFPSRSSSRAKR